MFFKSDVAFEYNIRKGAVSQKGLLPDCGDLFDIVHNSLYTDSFELILTRKVQIIKHPQTSAQKPIVVDIDKENLTVIVADKLTYPKEVRKFLEQEYKNIFNFDELNLLESKPVYFGGVREIEELGEINPNTGDRTTHTRRYIECRQLTHQDIVVNKKECLHQIWPVKRDQMPFEMLKFLKTNEIIY